MVQILEHRMWKRISTPFEIQAPGTPGGILRLVSQRELIKPSCRPALVPAPVIHPERHSKILRRFAYPFPAAQKSSGARVVSILPRASNDSGDEVTANQELPRKISKISKAFSRMITAAVNQARAATHQELANWPILLLSPVNCTSGTSANGN